MSNVFSRLTTRVSIALILVVVLSMAVLMRHWAFVTTPTLKAAEQTKAELLITPYTELLEVAVNEGDQTRLENILNQLILLEDPTYHQPIIVSLKVALVDGRVIERRNQVAQSIEPFRAETPLFSPTTMELLGSVKLEYNDVFYRRLINEVWREVAWSIAIALLLLLVVQYWVRRLLQPLTDLSSRLANVDLNLQNKLPPASRTMSAEIRQLWSAIERLFARLRQRDAALEAEHEAAQKALHAKLEAEAASKEKSQFLANMSHELRTPLNAIIGYSEMLYEDAGDSGNAELAGDLVRIVSSGRHLLSLINDVLDLSKIEAGKMQLFLEDFALPRLVADVVNTVSPLATANGNALLVQCDERIGSIHADISKLRQALINILGNAAKFTHDGKITFSVARVTDNEEEWIFFRSVDSGIGISEEQQKFLFNAFTQADESTTRQYGGTGLGLTISRSICRLMGGDITVSSQAGEGSEFTICIPAYVRVPAESETDAEIVTLPAVTIDPNERRLQDCRDEDDTGERREKLANVLVIDGDQAVGDLLQRSLAQEGFKVESAINGRLGLERAVEQLPNLILLDSVLPDMNGLQVLTQIKKNPLLAHVPVIMHSMADERATAAALGGADYITKPAGRDELVSVVKRNVRAKQTQVILVVDDDVDSRRLTRMVFENEGWNIVEAADGEVALMRVAEHQPAVIVLDLSMPRMNGAAFLRELDKSPDWRSIPVMALTASELSAEDRARLLRRVDLIVEKGPYSLDTLLRRLRELMRTDIMEAVS